jgi:succinate dehydrogenase / fumarate reductase flavoprotein subunit
MNHARNFSGPPSTRAVDVLVIGGGVTGMYAALAAHEAGASVLLASKGPIGRSGGSVFAGTLVAYLDPAILGYDRPPPGDRPLFSSKYYNLMDEPHLERSANFINERLLPELERLGLYFRRLPDGRILHNPTRPKHTWTPMMGMSGRAIADLLRRRVFDAAIPVVEETMATSLTVAGGECHGATFLDIVGGEFFAVSAKATILATGHANYLAKRSSGTREVCGDGIALPYRAGAELFNIEMVEWHVTDMAWPAAWSRLHIYPNPLPATQETARLVAGGRVLFEQKALPKVNKPYHYQHMKLLEHARATGVPYESYKAGGYYSDLRHIDPAILGEYSYQTQFPRKLGIDLGTEPLENAPVYHYTLGGVWVDFHTMESRSLRRLYAAGAATGRDGQTDCMYEGRVAAEAALRAYAGGEPPEPDPGLIEREDARVHAILKADPASGVPPIAVKEAIREVMWERMDYTKNRSDMLSALDELESIRQSLVPRIKVGTTSRNYNYDWVDGLDVHNMLEACALTIRASLHRKESRGPFFREDYPYQDNANWLKYVILGRDADGPRIREEPVAPPASVRRDVVDFFET